MSVNHEPMSRATPMGDAGDQRKDVGSLLRASRLRCGEELEDVAQVLRIRRRHIQAIEDGDFASLPGMTYAVGFIRAYADYLGLDSEEVVRRFKESQAPQTGKSKKAELSFPSPMSETGVPRGAVVFLGIIIGLIVYGGWYTSTVDNAFFKRWIEPVPARLAALLPGSSDAPMPNTETKVTTGGNIADVESPNSPNSDASVDQMATTVTTDQPVISPATETTATAVLPDTSVEVTSSAPVSEATDGTVGEIVDETVTSAAEPVAADVVQPSENQTTEVVPAVEPTVEATSSLGVAPASTNAAEVPTPNAAQSEVTQGPTSNETSSSVTAEPAPNTPVLDAPRAPTAESSVNSPSTSTSETVAGVNSVVPAESVGNSGATAEVAATPATAEARIIVTAISDSWVEVRELGSDEWVWGKLLKTGESYAVPDRDDLKLKSGNAGGLAITVDGASVPAIGASGEVVRNVLLDPDRLKAGRAVFR